MPNVKATAWIVVEGNVAWSSLKGKNVMRGLRVAAVRANKPDVAANQEAIEISIELPEDYFDNQNPKVEVIVPPKQPTQTTTTVHAQVKPKAPSAAAAIIHGGN